MTQIPESFQALVVRESTDNQFERQVEERHTSDLPPGDLLIHVEYSSLNYKDALSASGNRGVTRHYPHTPGIDAAGTVLESTHPDWNNGDAVLVTGFDLGMNTAGGFGQRIRVPAEWVLPLPQGMTSRTAMSYGTAGLTAAICVDRLVQHGLTSDMGPILVSGGSGGVGSIALMILKKLGFSVTAVNGRTDRTDYLRSLGADEIIPLEEAIDTSGKPLLRSRWAGAVDTLGGDILATTLKTVQKRGIIACCGNAASHQLSTTVLPFILNGLTLTGTDSAHCPLPERHRLWALLADEWAPEGLNAIIHECPLAELNPAIDAMLSSASPGRTLVRLEA